ncbi:MAG: DNA internalization-related competence protein ComEC/Rec2 [Sedimenticola sp.]|nr:DNA internalization-related competence protein ComEC/Rec2 [Sedimenticola sp.]
MIQFTVAFMAGVLLLQHQTQLLPLFVTGLLPAVILALCRLPRRVWIVAPLALLLGLLWANSMAHLALRSGLPPELEGRELALTGYIDSIPEVTPRRTRFRFQVESMSSDGIVVDSPGTVLLSWYQDAPDLKPGDRWNLRVRLKRPHGMLNPGSMDYERSLFSRGIRATGYVRNANLNHLVGEAGGPVLVHRLRQYIGDRLAPHIGAGPVAGVIRALVIGDRSRIGDQQWELFRRTGTNHLVAISGLHIGIVSGLLLLLGSRLWRCSSALCLRLPAQQAGALIAILGALCYAALAGFALPCVRALVMLLVVLGGLLLRRPVLPSRSLCIALLLVVMMDPLSVMLPGFWLSFGAVAVIILSVSGRVPGQQGVFRTLLRIQWVVALGLAPVLLLLGFGVPLVAPLVNLVAVPLFSLLLVPLCLGGAMLLLLFPPLGAIVLGMAVWLAGLFQFLLIEVAEHLGPLVSLAGNPPQILILGALSSVFLLLLPAGIPGRWSGLLLLLPLLLHRPDRPPSGEAWVTMLDVGQGLAVVVQTSRHLMLYDTGPRFASGFDTGRAVVLPYLRFLGVDQVDRIVVSNGDMDHRGGLDSVIDAFPDARLTSGEPDRLVAGRANRCQAGERWTWDGVMFEVLHPGREATWRGNNASCVLSVRSAGGAVLLLTGDIERAAEEALLRQGEGQLEADVVSVPHHGSGTSSGSRFVSATGAAYALVSAGYRNRYGFPRPEVVQRWQSAGARLINTADAGAVMLQLAADGSLRGPQSQRQRVRRYWRDQ